MNVYDISMCEGGFCLSINGKRVAYGVEEVSDILEIVAESMDEEAIRILSLWNFTTQPTFSFKTDQLTASSPNVE